MTGPLGDSPTAVGASAASTPTATLVPAMPAWLAPCIGALTFGVLLTLMVGAGHLVRAAAARHSGRR